MSSGRFRDYTMYTQFGDWLINLDYWESKQEPDPNSDCIIWTGPKHRQGYGMCGGIRASNDKRFMTVTHRMAAVIANNRTFDRDEYIVHSCDNPLCVNPNHLIIGDAHIRNNMMIERGRTGKGGGVGKKFRGVHVPQNRQYKYTADEILWIRTANTIDIAKKFNMSRGDACKLRWGCQKGFKWLK